MAAYAPSAVEAAFDTVNAAMPQAELAGIYANKPGYHNSRNQLPSSDYSVQKSYDQEGDGNAAAALDITFHDPADMAAVTQRLINETQAHGDDGKLRALREFFGTVNGYSVTGMDVPGVYWVSSDDSHLWHVHCSGKRKYTNDHAAWQDVASVITGNAAPSGGNDDMGTFTTRTHSVKQTLSGDWKTIYIDDSTVTWLNGPAEFQAQLNINLDGLVAGSAVKLRWYADDVKGDDVDTHVNSWPTIEIIGTSGGTAASLVQLGKMGSPPSGWSRRLRCEAFSDAASGVSVTYVRASSFHQ